MLTIQRPPLLPAGNRQVLPFAMNIDGLPLMAPGAHAFVVSIKDTEVERLPFRAMAPRPGHGNGPAPE